MLQRRLAISFLGALALIFTLVACGSESGTVAFDATKVACSQVTEKLASAKNALSSAKKAAEDAKGSPNADSATNEVKSVKKLVSDLQKRAATCAKQGQEDPPADDTAGIQDSDGELRSLPLVKADGTVIKGDSTSDPRTPATYADAKAKGSLRTWADAKERLGKVDWYVAGVNARKGKTGFDWSDVEKWATATDIDPRVIHVFNMDITDQQARDAVRELVGSDADRLPIARHTDINCIINTRGFGREQMQDFVDCRKMIRVALAPIVYNEKGEPAALSPNTGVFIDCFNEFWLPKQVVPGGPPPSPPAGTPVTTVPAGPPGSTPTPSTAPPTTRPTGTTIPSPTTTRPTPPPCTHKCVANSPVSSDPNDPNEPTRPNTTEPPRPPSTAPSTTQQSTVPTPTTAAPPAPPPPTTAPAPPPVETCQDPYGTGICEE